MNAQQLGAALRVVAAVVVVAACIYLAANLGAAMAIARVAGLLRQQQQQQHQPPAAPTPQVIVSADASEIDFCPASGISPERLKQYFDQMRGEQPTAAPTLALILKNAQGESLFDGNVLVRFSGGERQAFIGRSGVLRLELREAMLPGFRIVAPAGYTQLAQLSIPEGAAYVAESKFVAPSAGDFYVADHELEARLRRGLTRFAAEKDSLSGATLQQQLGRTTTDAPLPAAGATELVSAAELYRARCDSVVVIGHLLASGEVVHGAGVVVRDDGLIATAFHVVDKPAAIARAVMTRDGRVFPIREALAGNRAHDVALVKIDATGLAAAPVAMGDAVGTPVAIIGHPAGQHFMLTQGAIARYASAIQYGDAALLMGVTAEFADGSSGAPVFNMQGEVTGIVSSTNSSSEQMVVRFAAPAVSLRMLLGEAPPDSVPLDLAE